MSKTTSTLLGKEARKAVLQGVNSVYGPVRRTFGPQGKNALLFRTFNRGSRITNDGVTVAECQEPKNQHVRLAAQAFKESCKRTAEKVGDGTTLTTILGGKLYNDVNTLLTEGASEFTSKKVGVMTLRKKILESAEKIKAAIKESAKKIENLGELEKIATISVEDAELGKTIAKMAMEVGIDGFIDVVEGYKGEIETEIIKGFRFPAKVPAKAFVNNPARYEMLATDCPVLITNYALDGGEGIARILQELNSSTSKLIVIAPSFSDNVLVNMVNASKAGFFLFPTKVPSLRTEQFEDLALYCGARFIDKNKGHLIRAIKATDLGFLEKLVIKDTELREDAVATGGKGEREETMTIMEEVEENGKKKKQMKEKVSSPIAERIATLKSQLIETKQESFKKLMERRIASMASAVGVIRVGDSTNASSLYRKLKIEDAVYACKAALRGGYVRGAGILLSELAKTLSEDDILRSALEAPYKQIQESLGGSIEEPIEIPENVIDPAEALYYAVEHATSVVSILSTVDIITVENEETDPGESSLQMAAAMREVAIAMKRNFGQITEGQEEAMRDSMGGLTNDEVLTLDNG